MSLEELFDRRVPLALVAALCLQAGTVVWWAASRDSDLQFQHARINHIEDTQAQSTEAQAQILERLARIEERTATMVTLLDRMDKERRSLSKQRGD